MASLLLWLLSAQLATAVSEGAPAAEEDEVLVDGHRVVTRGNLSASSAAFLGATTELFASSGCLSCCTGGSCGQAWKDQSFGSCCRAEPAACCPSGTTCQVQGPQVMCMRAAGTPGYGGAGQYGAARGGYDTYGPQLTPVQRLLQGVRGNMGKLWMLLMLLGCLGIGGPFVHYAQMALCGMSIFNMCAPQDVQQQVYGPQYGY
mmetsp:Transcript_60230/g.145525  ORF Transcript_60230/g.145525 Transcript_60230/m.145525 type:complete len:203 (-) Transcript_60230:19-627(-)